MGQLRSAFRPEFLNRVDDIILFKPLSIQNIKGIIDKLIEDLQKRVAEQQINLTLTEEAKEFIAQTRIRSCLRCKAFKEVPPERNRDETCKGINCR